MTPTHWKVKCTKPDGWDRTGRRIWSIPSVFHSTWKTDRPTTKLCKTEANAKYVVGSLKAAGFEAEIIPCAMIELTPEQITAGGGVIPDSEIGWSMIVNMYGDEWYGSSEAP